MGTSETRLLLLGVTASLEPVNGYQVRRELITWGADQWARIKPGSIYGGLATLSRQGHLQSHSLSDDGRPVTVYTTTRQGRDLLQDLIADALIHVQIHSTMGLSCAFAVGGAMPRSTFATHLRTRRDTLTALLDEPPPFDVDHSDVAPPLALQPYALWRRQAATEVEFLTTTIDRIERDDFHFTDETPWCPAQPTAEAQHQETTRQRYQELIAAQHNASAAS